MYCKNTVYRCNYWLFIIFPLSCGLSVNLDARKCKKEVVQEKKSAVVLLKQQKSQEKSVLQKQVTAKSSYIVRVLLHSWPVNQQKAIRLESPAGFGLADPQNRSDRLTLGAHTISIATIDGNITLQGKKVVRDHFYLTPKEGYISFNGKSYKGVILVVRDKNKILLINCVDLEDYICSVLHTESWPGWPLEVNKVFAIVSRSYAMAMMRQKRNSFYHVCDSNVHQTYSGGHTLQIFRDAADTTKGLFLTYGDKPILAMFDSCCGGLVPAHIADFDFSKAPYLARSYSCKHCKRCKIYQWQAEYDCADFEKILRNAVPRLSKLKNIRVSKKDKAGIVQEVVLDPGSHKISGKKLYSLLKQVKSFCFSVKCNRNKISFMGRGFGHHIGLCQWGVREMVRDGWDYKRVLRFYYPDTKLARLK